MAYVTPEMFGAVGDDPGDGTGTDDRAAFQAALNASRRLVLDQNKTYRIHGELELPRFQQVIGTGIRSASWYWPQIGQTGSTQLIFTGSGEACFKSQNPNVMLSHGGLKGFTMRVIGSYSHMMYFRDVVDWHIIDVGMETDSLTMNGIYCSKIAMENPSWLNGLFNVAIRLPDESTGNPVSVDWSDSRVECSHLCGGSGSVDRGYGTRWLNNQIERASYAGLAIVKTGGIAVKNTICIGNSFDANAAHGIVFVAANDTSGTRKFHTVVNGNNFRTTHPVTGAAGGSSIGMNNTTGNSYSVGPIVGNVELHPGVPQLAKAGTWTTPQNIGNMQA